MLFRSDLARVALERQLVAENDVESVQHSITAQIESADKLKNGLDQMTIKLSELLRKRDSLAARSRTAHAQARSRQAVKGIDIMDPASEIARFDENVRREEERVRGAEELPASSLGAQFASLADLADNAEIEEIEERLKELKAGRAMAAARARAQDQQDRLDRLYRQDQPHRQDRQDRQDQPFR